MFGKSRSSHAHIFEAREPSDLTSSVPLPSHRKRHMKIATGMDTVKKSTERAEIGPVRLLFQHRAHVAPRLPTPSGNTSLRKNFLQRRLRNFDTRLWFTR